MPSAESRKGAGPQSFALGDASPDFQQSVERWNREGHCARLWEADASLWTGSDENRWLGWLDAVRSSQGELPTLQDLAESVRQDAIHDVVVMGMGGSSLCPDVLARTFAPTSGWPRLHVLDSTVPAQIQRLRDTIDLSSSLFIVPSKSGTTIEPNSFQRRFFSDVEAALPGARAASRFIAITDPGSPLDEEARQGGFRCVAHGTPSIGGRFSALSVFGLLPACLAGLDVASLLRRAAAMADACGPGVAAPENPGATLGLALGVLARRGRDKLSLVISPGVRALGGWLEQLIAESTGKQGTGIVPIADEPLAGPEFYGDDRSFAYLRLANAPSQEQEDAVAALEAAGHPVLRIDMQDPLDLGAEFFRWEFATAVAGSVLEVNPFDQPDVETAKQAARQLMEHFEVAGDLPNPPPSCSASGADVYSDPALTAAPDLESQLARHLERLGPGDYFAINAFIDMSDANEDALQRMRRAVRDRYRVATTVGFGPRFLHSTGQLHKGGPASGLFLQITSKDAVDLEIPGRGFSFGVLKQAQAIGDFQVLSQRGRRILRIHLEDASEGRIEELARSIEAITAAPPATPNGETS
jgi:transaldolase/glucose-6-phosphate isomerase